MDADDMKLPELIDIPAGAPSKECSCGARVWWVIRNDKRIPVACPPFIKTKAVPRLELPTAVPTSRTHGVGINHKIDCPDSAKFRAQSAKTNGAPVPVSDRPATAALAHVDAPPPPDPGSIEARIRDAVALSEQHGLRCSGAPHIPERCGGFAVCVLRIGGKLFSTPCSAHADAITNEIVWAGRKRDLLANTVDAFLVDLGPKAAAVFLARAARLREINHRDGFKVPKRGPMVIL